jgi:hypothetical protein
MKSMKIWTLNRSFPFLIMFCKINF